MLTRRGAPRPLQNRVTPFGEIVAVRARGTLMGNRGIIHDPASKRLLSRRWQHQAWICCRLACKGYRHPIMGRGAYTELFFLDEATAFAAGHRPCGYYRRTDFNAFKHAWMVANLPGRDDRRINIVVVDRRLHRERVTRRREQITYEAALDRLPSGAFVALGDRAVLVQDRQLRPWTPSGYGPSIAREASSPVTVLTPRSVVAALCAGYRPAVHPSATI